MVSIETIATFGGSQTLGGDPAFPFSKSAPEWMKGKLDDHTDPELQPKSPPPPFSGTNPSAPKHLKPHRRVPGARPGMAWAAWPSSSCHSRARTTQQARSSAPRHPSRGGGLLGVRGRRGRGGGCIKKTTRFSLALRLALGALPPPELSKLAPHL